ncbi:MAG: hypothetical protein ACI4RM_01180 [Ruminococcus sp.]
MGLFDIIASKAANQPGNAVKQGVSNASFWCPLGCGNKPPVQPGDHKKL